MKSGATRFWTSLFSGVLVFVLFVVIIPLTGQIEGRVDLTPDKRFTLPEEAREIAKRLDDEFNVTVYLSDPLPKYISHLPRTLRSRLEEFEAANDEWFRFEFVNPDEWGEEDERKQDLLERKIQPLPLRDLDEGKQTTGSYWMTLEFVYQKQEEVLPLASLGNLLTDETEVLRVLPFQIASRIVKLINPEARVGIAGVKGPAGVDPQNNNQPKESDGLENLRAQLKGAIENINDIDFFGGSPIGSEVNTLLVHRPRDLDEAKMRRLDQYLLNGGNVIVTLDNFETMDLFQRMVDWQSAFVRDAGRLRVKPLELGAMRDWLRKHGVVVGEGYLASATPDRTPFSRLEMDRDPATGRPVMKQKTTWRENPSIISISERDKDGNDTGSFNADSSLLAGLGRVAVMAPVPLTIQRDAEATALMDDTTIEVLLQTPEDTFVEQLVDGRMQLFRQEGAGSLPEKATWKRWPLVVSIRGNFRSSYPVEEGRGESQDLTEIQIPESAKPGHLIVVADTDFTSDQSLAAVANNPQLRGASLGSPTAPRAMSALMVGLTRTIDSMTLGDELVQMRRPPLAKRLLDTERVEEDRGGIRLKGIGIPAVIAVGLGLLAWLVRMLTTGSSSNAPVPAPAPVSASVSPPPTPGGKDS